MLSLPRSAKRTTVQSVLDACGRAAAELLYANGGHINEAAPNPSRGPVSDLLREGEPMPYVPRKVHVVT